MKHSLSVLKGISWRVIATIDTITLSFIYTGNIGNSFKIGFIELFTKIFLFYLHERLWLKIKWGRKQKLPEIVSPDENVIDEVFDTAPIYEETHARSFIKGISWRFFGTLDTIIIASFITNDFSKALKIGATELITKIILFYIHERIWQHFMNKPKDK